MGKYEKKKKRVLPKWILVICLLLLLGFLVLFVVPQVLYRMNPEPEAEEFEASQNEQTQETDAAEYEWQDAVEFPVKLEDGKVEIESLFPFSGVNPDSGKQEAVDTAAIVLRNTSDTYLKEAKVTAVLGDGTELVFRATDIPAGEAAMAFSVENADLLATDLCVDLMAETSFEEVQSVEALEAFADGMTITLQNTSAEDLEQIAVYYRDVFDDKYFGGMAYTCAIEKLAAGETVTVQAGESLLGVIEVVRVAVNHKN